MRNGIGFVDVVRPWPEVQDRWRYSYQLPDGGESSGRIIEIQTAKERKISKEKIPQLFEISAFTNKTFLAFRLK